MNTILQEQNTQKQLDRLAAQRQLYSDAKTILAIQIILTVPCVIAWSFLVTVWPSLKVYTALWGIVLTLADIVILTPWQRDLKKKAAKIQELFDCDVLALQWHKLKVGRQPDPEVIAATASRYRKKESEYTSLKNWYPVFVDKLPMRIGKIVCQRAGCWWDASLRRRYASHVDVVLAVLSVLVVVLSIVGGFTMEKFILAGLSPLMPAVILGLRQSREHREAAERADRLKEACEDLWGTALSANVTEEELLRRSRQLQDEIYEHRRQSPLIFDWIYKHLRDAHEDQMIQGAEALVQEALNIAHPTQ